MNCLRRIGSTHPFQLFNWPQKHSPLNLRLPTLRNLCTNHLKNKTFKIEEETEESALAQIYKRVYSEETENLPEKTPNNLSNATRRKPATPEDEDRLIPCPLVKIIFNF